MRIRLDSITVVNLPSPGGSRQQAVEVHLFVGEAKMVTKRSNYVGSMLTFPDIYEFAVDNIAFAMDLVELEVEVYNVANEAAPVQLGSGKVILRRAIPRLNEPLSFSVSLINAMNQRSETKFRAILSEGETLIEDLHETCRNLDELRSAYDKLLQEVPAREAEYEKIIIESQSKLETVSKKHNAIVQKYNDMQDKYSTLGIEYEKVQNALRNERMKAGKSDSEALAAQQQINDELTQRVAQLSQHNEKLLTTLRTEAEENEKLTNELSETLTVKMECELKIAELENESHSRREETLQHLELIKSLNESTKALNEEISRLRSLAVSRSITYQSSALSITNISISNTYIEQIMNSTMINHSVVKKELLCPDIEVLRAEVIAQCKKNEELRMRQTALLERVFIATQPILVCLRTRPPFEEEKEQLVVANTGFSKDVQVYLPEEQQWKCQEVDLHWAYDVTQAEVFAELEPLMAVLVPRISAEEVHVAHRQMCVMFYGGAGSGKSFTALGFGEHAGVAYRAIQRIFDLIDLQIHHVQLNQAHTREIGGEDLESLPSYELKLSIYEVYNNKALDLLAEPSPRSLSTAAFMYDSSNNVASVKGAQLLKVTNVEHAVRSVATALHRRNANASLIIEFHVERVLAGDRTYATLRLVDLHACDTQPKDREVQAMEDVLLAVGNQSKANYQQNALTTMLWPALCGHPHSRAVLICCLAPHAKALPSTLQTLQFAQKARAIFRPQQTTGENSRIDSVEMRSTMMRNKTLTNELQESRQRTEVVEESLVETRSMAEDLITQMNERNRLIFDHYQEAKTQAKQLQRDLELTQRNLRQVLETR